VKHMIKNQQNRKALKIKMSQALKEEVEALSTQMQDILIDDLVTAFESRFAVLNKVQSNLECTVEVGVEVSQ
jgi:hypothetical protein